jgi:hypothetical protein
LLFSYYEGEGRERGKIARSQFITRDLVLEGVEEGGSSS